jgi:DNA-binding YbaB/EbfC family protein
LAFAAKAPSQPEVIEGAIILGGVFSPKRPTSEMFPGRSLIGVKTPRYFTSGLQACFPMAGVGKLLKTAQKMQRSIEALQSQLEARELEVAAGGGAIKVRITGSGRFVSLQLDPEFLKEDPKLVADTILAAVQDAAKQSKELNESEMKKATSPFQMPGMF